MNTLDKRSEINLAGVHPDLQRVIRHAIAKTSPALCFVVTESVRTIDRQRKLLLAGATKTLKSRHLTGHAVDIAVKVNGVVRWDWPLYNNMANVIKASAKACNVPIIWGGDWRTFKDGPHYELPKAVYQ